MATLIPSIGTCVSRMTPGERRLAERLEQKLDDYHLRWYNAPIGPKVAHPNFALTHPRRGLLVLEDKDWRLSTILRADRQNREIIPDGIPKSVITPVAAGIDQCLIQSHCRNETNSQKYQALPSYRRRSGWGLKLAKQRLRFEHKDRSQFGNLSEKRDDDAA